jgi:hypothetical protein
MLNLKMTYFEGEVMNKIFEEILAERKRQDEKWGEQNHSLYTSIETNNEIKKYPDRSVLERALLCCRRRMEADKCWFDILLKEICEAFWEETPEKQWEKMVQVAAVAVEIIEYLDRENNRKEGIA